MRAGYAAGCAADAPSDVPPDVPPGHAVALSVLDDLDPPLREFLTGSCVLAVLDAHACDVLLGRDDSAGMLAELERRGVVVPEGTSGEPARYRLPDARARGALAAARAADRAGPDAPGVPPGRRGARAER
jgi:hypothetical protein